MWTVNLFSVLTDITGVGGKILGVMVLVLGLEYVKSMLKPPKRRRREKWYEGEEWFKEGNYEPEDLMTWRERRRWDRYRERPSHL